MNVQICVIYLMCDDIVTLLTTLSVQVILQLRVYALYKRSRKVLIFLMTIFAFEISTMVVLIGITMKHLENIPLISTSTGCYYKGLLQLSAVFWAPGLVYEPILFGMIAYKAWGRKILNEPRIPLVTKMARDSLLYFIIIFVELLISTVIWAHEPTYINLVNPWSAALPSILGSRLLLNMREMVARSGTDTYILESFDDTLTFTSPTADRGPTFHQSHDSQNLSASDSTEITMSYELQSPERTARGSGDDIESSLVIWTRSPTYINLILPVST
ncbi:hypothetical protein ABKN59_008752 [Abortiporus biennis]